MEPSRLRRPYNDGSISQYGGQAGMNITDEGKLRRVMSWLAVILVACMTMVFFAIICMRGIQDRAWVTVTQQHFAAVVGLPAAAVAALFLVLVLRMADGP